MENKYRIKIIESHSGEKLFVPQVGEPTIIFNLPIYYRWYYLVEWEGGVEKFKSHNILFYDETNAIKLINQYKQILIDIKNGMTKSITYREI